MTFERLSAKRKDGKDSDTPNSGVPESEASKNGAQKQSVSFKRSQPRRKAQPRLLPELFMDETRNKSNTPRSVASSTLAERTRDKLKRGNLNPNTYIDKTCNHLENFCCQGKYSAVKRLLAAGINPGTSDKKRPSPLLNAVLGASYSHNRCVAYLLRYGANPHIVARKRYKKTLLQLAIENDASEGSGYINLVNMLVFAGVDPNAHDANGECTLHKIFKGPDKSGLADHKLEALALLLQSEAREGTNVNIQVSGTLDTPLHLAVNRHSAMAVAMLLKKGANVNAVNSSGSTPLLSTALMWRGELDDEEQQILELLSEHEEVDLNATSGAKKRTALHHAVFAGAVTAVELLLEKGADPRAKDADGKDPIERLQSDRRRASPDDDDIRALIYHACLAPATVLEEQQASQNE